MILGYSGTSDEVRIPAKIEGKPVTSLSIGAFLRNKTIKK